MIESMEYPCLMGVVNVTPDSFSDGGHFLCTEKATEHALQLLQDGASVLDIGGESTRPNAMPISPAQEQDRILPVIEAIKKEIPQALISVDTRNADTMRLAVQSKANIINDISALTYDSNSLNIISKSQVSVILMHMQGSPQTMQINPFYKNVVEEVYTYLEGRIQACVAAGISQDRIWIDVGIGFGKTLEHNLMLLKNIDKFHELKCPIVLGASRKSFIEKIFSNTPPQDRLAGSLASMLYGYAKGVQIFRVHDVKESKQALSVWQAIDSGGIK